MTAHGLFYPKTWCDGYVLLCDSIRTKRRAVTKLLLMSGCKVNSRNKIHSQTPLHLAVEKQDIEIVGMLLDRGANINAKNDCGSTPLHCAIIFKNVEVTKLLLRSGADVNAKNRCSTSPLHDAVQRACLLNINCEEDSGEIIENEKEEEEIIKLLLSNGANVDAIETDGATFLYIAAESGLLQIVKLLLKHGASVNYGCTSSWREGYTPLHIAAERGNIKIVKLLLSSNAHINASTRDNLTPIYLATESGHKNVVKLLLDLGANVDTQDKNGKTILHLAAQKGYSNIIEHILKHCPDVNNKSNRSSLNTAVYGYEKNYSKIVESLLRYGFSVDPEDINNYKLLHASIEKGYLKIVESLLKYGIDVNMQYTLGYGSAYTPLLTAIKYKQAKVAALLINYGADVNVQDEVSKPVVAYTIENCDCEMFKLLRSKGIDIKDSELLNAAVQIGCREIVEALLRHDIDINARDKYGRTALHFTALNESELFCTNLHLFRPNKHSDKVEIAKLLLSMGANVDAKDITGNTALYAATMSKYIEVVEVLLEYNADVNSANYYGSTPLHISAENGNEIISITLLNKGANVNAEDEDRSTALHMAARYGYKKVVEVLFKYGAKVDYTDKESMTPLHIAVHNDHLEIAKILLKFGADVDSRDVYGKTALHYACFGCNVSIVLALLENGSDINVCNENNCTPLHVMGANSSMFNFDPIKEILKKHIIKMKTANLYVNKSNLSCIINNTELNKFQCECEKEIESMKVVNISNTNVSFYDILRKNISQLAIYTRNKNIVRVLKSNDYKKKFPIYTSIINNRFRKGVERKELLEQVNKFVCFLFNRFPQLPYDCTDKILSYLNNKDFRILINTCEHGNIPNTDKLYRKYLNYKK